MFAFKTLVSAYVVGFFTASIFYRGGNATTYIGIAVIVSFAVLNEVLDRRDRVSQKT